MGRWPAFPWSRREFRMARIAGVNIPTNKRVEIALTYIHGIGRTKAKQIAAKLGIAPERRGQGPPPQEELPNRETIDGGHPGGGGPPRQGAVDIKQPVGPPSS